MTTCYHWSLHVIVPILDHTMTTCYHWTLWVLIADRSMTTYHHCVWFLTVLLWNFAETRGPPSLWYGIITLRWSFPLLPIGTVNVSVMDLLTVFVPYFKYLTLAIHCFTNVYCVQFLKILHMKISHFHSCTPVLLKYRVS